MKDGKNWILYGGNGAGKILILSLEQLSSRQPISVILVTHHTEEITPLFKRILVLHEGRSLFSGGIEGGIFQKIFGRNVRVMELEGRYYTVLSKEYRAFGVAMQ
jgi:ABC-type molybdenum transport system ATPase subunit/photorepair protein PhrA